MTSSIKSQLINDYYINVASYSILYYDYTLTLPNEVDRFWSIGSLSWVSGFFYLNRYLAFFGHIPFVFQDFWVSDSTGSHKICTLLSAYHQYLAVSIQVIVSILLIMRTYALYDRNLRVLLFICTCGFAFLAFSTWTVATAWHPHTTNVINLRIACHSPLSHHNAKRIANAWIAMLLFEALIFAMTVYMSLARWRRDGRSELVRVLLRDGAIYFGIMMSAVLANILTFYMSPEYQRGAVTTLTNTLSSTMMSRLMLNLRHPQLTMRLPISPVHRSSDMVLSSIVDIHNDLP